MVLFLWAIIDREVFVSEFSRSRTPVVLAGTVDVEHQLPSVNIDYKNATADAVRHC